MKETFTNIVATFLMVNPRTNHKIVATIERTESGASAYGDRSCHIVKYYDYDKKEIYADDFYDTRYDHISTEKKEWSNWWKENVFEYLGYKAVELETFKTKEVAYAKRNGVRLA